MKKIAIACSALCLALAASADVKYTITGRTAQEMDGQTVYLSIVSKNSRVPQDSAKIENGAFVLKGNADYPDVAYVYVARMGVRALVSIEDGVNVTVDLTAGGKQSGGALSARMNEYADTTAVYDRMAADLKLNELSVEYRNPQTTDARRGEITKVFNDLRSRQTTACNALLQKNKDNVLGAYLFQMVRGLYSDDAAEQLILSAGKEFQDYPATRSMLAQLNASKVRRPGNKFIDFEMEDMNGTVRKLSEFVGNGKYVLVDFWASWCGPCRAEIPHVKAAYEKFHDKGFEIVGVSLDNKKDAWLKAIEQMGLTWPQLSDLQGWKNAAAQKYGVNSIPCTLLLDPNGVIIGANYRGEQLEQKLGELLK